MDELIIAKLDNIAAAHEALIRDKYALQNALRASQERERELTESLGQIERMKMFPDDVINRTTLQAAIHIARAIIDKHKPA